LTVNASAEKSGLPTIAAINGVIKSFTSAVTTAPKAAPITHGDGEIENVAPQHELLKTLQHFPLPRSGAGRRILLLEAHFADDETAAFVQRLLRTVDEHRYPRSRGLRRFGRHRARRSCYGVSSNNGRKS
jgi:hypothetical protein